MNQSPIAWTPLLKPKLVPLVAIRLHPSQQLTRLTYLHLLGERIQRMVDSSPDPKVAVKELVQAMFEEGLLSDTGNCPPSEAGNRLILSNSEVEEILTNLGVFRRLTKAKPPLVENLMAHQALMSDRDDPLGRLKTWASQMGQEP